MQFILGIATKQLATEEYIATGITYYGTKPAFSTRGMTLSFMENHLLSVVHITHEDELKAINSVIQRTFEVLYLKSLIANPINGTPSITIYTKKKYSNNRLVVRHKTLNNHWILTGAKRALEEKQGAKHGKGSPRTNRTTRRR
jgi:hypothetical protein